MEQNNQPSSTLISGFLHRSDINDFLTEDEFLIYKNINLRLYKALTKLWDMTEDKPEMRSGYYVPINFFNLLYDQVDIILRYRTKPDKIRQHLKGLALDDTIKTLLLAILRDFNEWRVERGEDNAPGNIRYDRNLEICNKLIEEEYELMHALVAPDMPLYTFTFEDLQFNLAIITDPVDKIQYLLDRISFCKKEIAKSKPGDFKDDGTVFIRLCELEIERIKSLQAEGYYNEETPEPEYLLPLETLKKVHEAFNGEIWEEIKLNHFYTLFDINNSAKLEFKVKKVIDFYALLWSMHKLSETRITQMQFVKPLLDRYDLNYGSFGNILKNRIDSPKKKDRDIMMRIRKALK